jgi:hypothetical protein
MACDQTLQPGQSLEERMAEVSAVLRRLKQALQSGVVKIGIGPNGAVTFTGWQDRRGLSDACTYRVLSAENSWELRQAVQRAEALSGRKVNTRAVAMGTHSHDGGKTWERH